MNYIYNEMKRITLLFVFSLILLSCSKKEVDYKQINYRNEIAYEINSNIPYTGIVNIYSKKGYLYSQVEMKDGRDLINTTFYPNGQIKEIYNQQTKEFIWYKSNGELTKEKPVMDNLLEIDLDI